VELCDEIKVIAMENQRDYFSLLIPAYLRGELDKEDVSKLEAAARKDPEIAADIEFQRNLRSAAAEDLSKESGWSRLQAAMKSEASVFAPETPALALVSSQEDVPSMKAANSNEPTGVSPFWRIAAVALAVVGIGHVTLNALQTEPAEDIYLTVSEAGYTQDATLKVGFSETALLTDISNFLRDTDGKIIEGPSALGLYSIAYKTSEACAAANARLSNLGDQPDVETVSGCE